MKSWLKRFGALIVVAIPAMLHAQNVTYHIKGRVGHLSAPAKAYLGYLDDSHNSHLDSAEIINGSFTFTGTADHPRKASIHINKKGTGLYGAGATEYIVLCLENGDITVTSPDSIQNAKISGGPVNADNNKMGLALKNETDKMHKLGAIYIAAPAEKKDSKIFTDSLTAKSHIIMAEETPIYMAFIKANPASIVSLFAIIEMGENNTDVSELEPAFNLLSPEIRGTKGGLDYAIKINQMKKTSVGAIAPDFTLADTLGKAVSLHDFKGKYVLVDFWASWCVPCRRENPNVLKAYNTYHEKNFTVVGISLDAAGAKNAWLKAVHEDRLPWMQISGLNGFNSDAAQLYAIHTIPQNFLIGPDGKIIAYNLRGDNLINKLKQVFGQ